MPGIDSLRAVAVLAVMAYHLRAEWLPGGFVGVDVFFVISGYVVATSLARATWPGGERFWPVALRFYGRRLARLYPALVLCLGISFLMAVLFIPSSWLSTTTWSTGLLAFAGLSNMGMVWLAEPYFSPRAEFNPFTHTWSLGVEEQFYLVFPWLATGWLLIRAGAHGRRIPKAVFFVLLLLSLLFSAWACRQRPEWGFYLLPSRFWQLAVGVVLAWTHQNGHALLRNKACIQSCLVLGLALICMACAVTTHLHFPLPGALMPVAGALLWITGVASVQRAGGSAVKWTAWPVAVYVGKISYVLYLWHWPVLVLARWTTGLDEPIQIVGAASLAFGLAILTHHLIEQPARRHFAQVEPYRLLFLGWGAVALVAMFCAALVWGRPLLSQSRAMQQALDWYPVVRADVVNGGQEALFSGCEDAVLVFGH